MRSEYFGNIEFWTREFRLPLFWLPMITGNNSLALYRNSVLHIYYLNNRNRNAAAAGYRFFTKRRNVAAYEKQARDILKRTEEMEEEYKSVKIRTATDAELKKRFFAVMKFLNRSAAVYTRTEAVCLGKLEEKKHGALIRKLGELRLILREKSEAIFYVLLGVLLKEISRRFGARVKDLFFYTEREIEALFGGKKAAPGIIKKRSGGYALLIVGNRQNLLLGDRFKKLFREVTFAGKPKELFGHPVMRGHVRGRIRAILHSRRNISAEVKRFRRDEILVTEMTRPDTVMACRKAAAIITDEGGLTSHAAIISRELGIPCIVGTKNATQILKDGDMVEVDAERGIVRILGKGKEAKNKNK